MRQKFLQLPSILLSKVGTEDPGRCNRTKTKIKKQERKKERYKGWKRVNKAIIYRRYDWIGRKSNRYKLLELINKFSKIASHRVDIQKQFVFLHVNNKQTEYKNF